MRVELDVELESTPRSWHLEEIVLDAHNQRKVWIGRDLWRWSGPTSYSNQGLNLIIQGPIKLSLEYF